LDEEEVCCPGPLFLSFLL